MSIRKHIPNCITSMNVLCGAIGVVFAFRGLLPAAFMFMLAGALCDYLDGFAARMLGAYSPMGKELDSLGDMTTFGVLPSMMMFNLMVSCGCPEILCYVPFIYVAFSALRLANYNVDPRQGMSFVGLTTPAAAMLVGSMASFVKTSPDSVLASMCSTQWFVPALAVVLSLLLVSGMPTFSMKFAKDFKADKATASKRMLLAVIALISLVITIVSGLYWTFAIFILFLCYALMCIVFWIFRV